MKSVLNMLVSIQNSNQAYIPVKDVGTDEFQRQAPFRVVRGRRFIGGWHLLAGVSPGAAALHVALRG